MKNNYLKGALGGTLFVGIIILFLGFDIINILDSGKSKNLIFLPFTIASYFAGMNGLILFFGGIIIYILIGAYVWGLYAGWREKKFPDNVFLKYIFILVFLFLIIDLIFLKLSS